MDNTMAAPTIEEVITVSIRSEFSKGNLDISERGLLHVLAIVQQASEVHAKKIKAEKAFKDYGGYNVMADA